MGAGKSTVGELLSAQLSLPGHDLDMEIEKKLGLSIPKIFSRLGETAFRKMEEEVLKGILSHSSSLCLATGGGAVLHKCLWETKGVLKVYLKGPLELLYERVQKRDDRPLLKSFSTFRKLYRLRKPFYERAELTIAIEGKTPQRIVDEISGTKIAIVNSRKQ